MGDHERLDPEIAAHYAGVSEQRRLEGWSLERVRTWELLSRHLPAPPAVVLDVGGAAGVYALPLAGRGYQVHLVDPMARHVEQALRAAGEQPAAPLASATVGDARQLDRPDASVDAVLLLGPLYHLTDRADRIRALTEARRVLRPGGVLAAAAISRFASTLDGLPRATWTTRPSRRSWSVTCATASTATRPGGRSGSPPPTSTCPMSSPRRSPSAGLRLRTVVAVAGPAGAGAGVRGPGDDERRQADQGVPRRRPAPGRGPLLLPRRLGRQARLRLPGPPAGPARGRRPGHPLELPAADGRLEAGPGPGRRQHRGPQAGRDDVR